MENYVPRIKRGNAHFEAAEQVIGQDKPRVMKSTGPAKEALEPALIEPVDRPVDLEWAANMAFAKELVTVRVAESTDKNAEQVVEIFNSGDRMLFPRGKEVTCERRFVETMARSKITSFTQKKVKIETTGIEQYVEVPHTALRYPFQVVRDDHPRGGDWLKSVLAEA